MMGLTDLQTRFVIAGANALDHGAILWWLSDETGLSDDSPNCAVLFPDGYVEFVVVRPGVKPGDIGDELRQAFRASHHPLRFIPNEASAESYWRKTAYRFGEASA